MIVMKENRESTYFVKWSNYLYFKVKSHQTQCYMSRDFFFCLFNYIVIIIIIFFHRVSWTSSSQCGCFRDALHGADFPPPPVEMRTSLVALRLVPKPILNEY